MDKAFIRKQICIGAMVAILATCIGYYAYAHLYHKYTFKFVKILITQEKMLPTFLTYAAMPNLLVFFVFIRRREDYKARGVLLVSFLIVLIMLLSKLLF